MNRHRLAPEGAAALALLVGGAGCAVGAFHTPGGFYAAWLAAFLLWLGLPLCGVTLVLVHDLTGGAWMATARPALNAAVATMPFASLSLIPALFGLHSLFSWTHPAPALGNVFYLNEPAFLGRYAAYVVLWNLLASFALWGPRRGGEPITAALSWLSALGLILLAFSASFAAIDWIMSLEPAFWSSVLPMIVAANWFNTGLALVLLTIAASPAGRQRDHMADLAALLLATTIFWAYVEFVQFLIIWEENLRREIAWYLLRIDSVWRPELLLSIGLGFAVPFVILLGRMGKHSRAAVAVAATLLIIGRIAHCWWLVLPESHALGPFWLDAAAVAAVGGLTLLPFLLTLRRGFARSSLPRPEEAGVA